MTVQYSQYSCLHIDVARNANSLSQLAQLHGSHAIGQAQTEARKMPEAPRKPSPFLRDSLFPLALVRAAMRSGRIWAWRD